MRIQVLCFLAVAASLSSLAAADSLRCGDKVVSPGDTKTDVLMKCRTGGYGQ